MTSTEYALRTKRLGMRYRRKWALRDCTLELPAGKVIALVGPNGAGKTTLLRMCVGLAVPTSGRVEVFGQSPTANTPQALSRVGFLAQDHPLYRHFTVADLLRFGRSCNVRFDEGLAVKRLSQLDIPLAQRAGSLSGGQQAQVALALALAKRPDLLVLDEPLASLDPLARLEFQQTLMSAVAADGVTVLFSSHVVHELKQVCDHLVLLNGGRVAIDGDIDELLGEHRLLVGPRVDAAPHKSSTVIEAMHADRHSTLLVRDGGVPLMPGWQAQPATLEDLVLAYLRRDTRASETYGNTCAEDTYRSSHVKNTHGHKNTDGGTSAMDTHRANGDKDTSTKNTYGDTSTKDTDHANGDKEAGRGNIDADTRKVNR